MTTKASTRAAPSARRSVPRLPREILLDIVDFVISDVYAAITREDGTHRTSWNLDVHRREDGQVNFFVKPEFNKDVRGGRRTPFQLLQAISQVDYGLRREVLKHFLPFPGAAFSTCRDSGLVWIAPGDTFVVESASRPGFWWSLSAALAGLSKFEKRILGTIQEVQLNDLEWMKRLEGEIGWAGIKKFLRIFPNLQKLIVGIPRKRAVVLHTDDDDMLSLTEASFANRAVMPPFLKTIWRAGVETFVWDSSHVAYFNRV